MSIFAKPLSALTTADLTELLSDNAVENLRLEFKREIPGKDETLKKISAFANTLGGLVVIGAEANSRDGRLTALSGVEQKPGYKQQLAQWCFDCLSPPLNVDISDPVASPTHESRVCYVIAVNESELAPHFINGRQGVYVRTNEFSSRFDAAFANERELHHLADRRRVVRERRSAIVERARNRFDIFAAQKYKELGSRPDGIGATFDLSIGPRFPALPLCDHDRLLSLIHSTLVPWRQVGFPRTTGGGVISQHESVLSLRPGSSFSVLEATTWGLLFYASEIQRDDMHDGRELKGMHSYHFVGQLLVFLEHARRILEQLGYSGPLNVELRLRTIQGVPWITFEEGYPSTGPASRLDDSVSFELETSSDNLLNKRDDLAMDLLKYVFFATDFSDATRPDRLAFYLNGGYGYNFWAATDDVDN